MHKIYLKKNIDSRIKEIYSKYKNVKQLDFEKDILSIPENRDLRFKRQSDGGYAFCHKVACSDAKSELINLIGNVTKSEKGLRVEQQKVRSAYFDNVFFSVLLIDKSISNDIKYDSLYLKVSDIENDNVAFNIRFFDDDFLEICNKIRCGKDSFDEFNSKRTEYYGINLRSYHLGYYKAIGFDVNEKSIFSTVKNGKNYMEIVIDFKKLELLFNNFEKKFHAQFLKNYIYGKHMAITSSWNQQASYILDSVQLGENEGYLLLNRSSNDKHFEILSDEKLEIINNKIKLNSFSKIYGIFSYDS